MQIAIDPNKRTGWGKSLNPVFFGFYHAVLWMFGTSTKNKNKK